jgi:hypothetical protein
MFKKIINFILIPFKKYIEHKKLKKRIAELKKRDPFIYK